MNGHADSVFSRRAALIAVTLCGLGTLGLVVCFASGFEVQVPLGGERRTTGVGIYAGAVGSERDITALVMAVAAAAFAASLVVSAGILPQMRRLKVPIMFVLAFCAMASLTGLVVLVSTLA